MTNIIYPACALFAWVFVLSGARQLTAVRREPERLPLWLMFLAFALVFTIGSSPLRRHLDGFAGVTEFSTWLTQSLVVAYSFAALSLLQLWSYKPAQARRRIKIGVAGAVAVLAAMAMLFHLSDPAHAGNHNFVHWYGASGYFDAYLLVYLAAYGATTVETARLCLRFAELMTRSWLRTGLRTTAVGALVSLVYVADRLTDVVVAHFGVSLVGWDALPEAGASIGSMLIMLGMTTQMWGPKTQGLVKRLRRLHAYTRLRPLWLALYARDPGIALDAPHRGRNRWLSVLRLASDFDYRVARRVIEVRDGVLALHPYLDADTTARARARAACLDLPDSELEAAVAAEQIRLGLAIGGRRPDAPRQQDSSVSMNNTPADLDAELAWLSLVSKHFSTPETPRVTVPGAVTAP